MKIRKILFIIICQLLFVSLSHAQDIRTTETKVADLLARFPANDLQFSDQLMLNMLSLGETGI